jgi:hypothetical protein
VHACALPCIAPCLVCLSIILSHAARGGLTTMSGKRPTDHLEPSAKKRTQDRQGRKGDEDDEDSEVTPVQVHSWFSGDETMSMRCYVIQSPCS